MGISVEEFCSTHPILYHMAEANSWPSILRHGLLSTAALLDLFEVTGKRRALLESTRRPDSATIHHPLYGAAVLRDQKPMRESVLRKSLLDCSKTEWMRFLNRKVFFWTTEERVNRLLHARAFRDRDHVVLSVSARSLLRIYEDRVLLSPINSGSTLFSGVSRGLFLFQPLASYPSAVRGTRKGNACQIAELTVDYAIPHILHLIHKVERRKQSTVIDVLYSCREERTLPKATALLPSPPAS